MAGRVKFDINGKGVDPADGGRMGYSGPNLPKGSYVARVKRMTLGAIKSAGANQGKPRISVLLEVCGPDRAKDYFGHPIWDGLNIIDSSVPFVNAFLHALTDGSESAKRAVETSFWDNGPMVKKVKVEKGAREGQVDQHITKIGKYAINSPDGELLVQVATKAGEYNGTFKAEVANYMPYVGPRDESTDDDEDDDDLLDDGDDYDDDDADYEDDESDDEEDYDDGDPDDESSSGRTKVKTGGGNEPPF